ncbi:type II secretion system protein [Bacillus sp. Bos-x628]|uniref:type II secretion system protein n=1 Tax=Bacillus maqinnsis TaxID=3229854 RepID=UPI0033900309
MLFACHLFIFASLILIPNYEKLVGGKKELRTRLEAYQVLHEQMNAAFMTGSKQSVKEKRGEIVYEVKWSEQEGCVSYKLQKQQTICFSTIE